MNNPMVLARNYVVERELGSGGMATVYLARDLKHARLVAIKVMRPELNATLGGERFLREIAMAASLSHPHILPLHDSGAENELLYYVMPYIEGGSLRDRLTRERLLPLDDALCLGREVGGALAYAHQQGLIHRDIKPENILLSGGHALVADFGIARAVSEGGSRRMTETGMAVGTPAYMSPEQATADAVDGRTDEYSLACVLYEMLAGEPPYAGPTAHAVLARRMVDPMPSLRAIRDTVPQQIEDALRRALAPAPADRFESVAAFLAALEAGPAPQPRSVAVLPFDNFSADPENEYFADGITEDVIAQLAKIGTLNVISRTSVMLYKKRQVSTREIADVLQVATLLEGSVRRAGNRVRIVAQLIDARTDQHLWAETYDRELTDIFAIQSDVALQIAAALKAELSPDQRSRIERQPTADMNAYQLYLKGRHSFLRYSPEGMRQAVGYYGEALARDPHFAQASAATAYAWTELFETGTASFADTHPFAMAAARRALEQDPLLADAHCVSAYASLVFQFEWQQAEAGFKRALELSPSYADAYDLYGRLCSAMGRLDEAIVLLHKAQVLDPLAHPVDLATAYLRAGRLEEALAHVEQSIAVDPRRPRAQATYGWVLMRLGRQDEGLAALERAVALAPDETSWLAQLGQATAEAGLMDRSNVLLQQLEDRARTRYVAPYHMAYVHTGQRSYDRAMDALEQAWEQRAGAVYSIKGSFLFAPLRSHPRFVALLNRMNLH